MDTRAHSGRRVQLYGGGMDSLCIWLLTGRPEQHYFTLGHRYEEVELEVLARLADAIPGFDINFRDELHLPDWEREDAHIPLRNVLLVTCAALDAPDWIYLGAVHGEASRDKSARFFKEMSDLLSYHHRRTVRVTAPAASLRKSMLISALIAEIGRVEATKLLSLTRSCYALTEYDPDLVGCGDCMACFRRWVAFSLNGIDERYAANPAQSRVARNRDEWVRQIRRLDPAMLPAVARNNLDAVKALRRAGA